MLALVLGADWLRLASLSKYWLSRVVVIVQVLTGLYLCRFGYLVREGTSSERKVRLER